MNARDRKILLKISGYVDDAISFAKGMSYDAFASDRKTLSATAFCIGQIGELAKEISDDMLVSTPEIPWKSIRNMRNRIVHDYENVKLTILWTTIADSLPELNLQIKSILRHENSKHRGMEYTEDYEDELER